MKTTRVRSYGDVLQCAEIRSRHKNTTQELAFKLKYDFIDYPYIKQRCPCFANVGAKFVYVATVVVQIIVTILPGVNSLIIT